MSLSETLDETGICNKALGRIGGLQIGNVETDTSSEAIQCRLHYESTRDALIRSHYWRFASDRASLEQDDTDPDFEYDNQFILPDDFMRLKNVFGDNFTITGSTGLSFALEGQRILTNCSSVDIRYIKKVTDVSEFDPLFVELLILTLADKLIGPLAGGDAQIQKKLDSTLDKLLPKVRALDRQETNTIGRLNRQPWLEGRLHTRVFTVGGRVIG